MMDISEEYVCEECGNTTSVPGEVCPSCGGLLTPLDEQAVLPSEEEGADSTDEGHTSLESLRDQEESEETPISYLE